MEENVIKKKRRTNGFGSGFADILVVVKRPYSAKFQKAGWEQHSESENDVTYKYSCKNYFPGDDETVVFTLWGDLPEGIDEAHFDIDWDNSVH